MKSSSTKSLIDLTKSWIVGFFLFTCLSGAAFANPAQSFYVFINANTNKLDVTESKTDLEAQAIEFVELESKKRREVVERSLGLLEDLFMGGPENTPQTIFEQMKTHNQGVWSESDAAFLEKLADLKYEGGSAGLSPKVFIKKIVTLAQRNKELAKLFFLDAFVHDKKKTIKADPLLNFSLKSLERQRSSVMAANSRSGMRKFGGILLHPSDAWQNRNHISWPITAALGIGSILGIHYLWNVRPYVKVDHAIVNPPKRYIDADQSGLIKNLIRKPGDFIYIGETLVEIDPTAEKKDEIALRNNAIVETLDQLQNEKRVLSSLKSQVSELQFTRQQAKISSNRQTSTSLSTNAGIARSEASSLRSQVLAANSEIGVADNRIRQAIAERDRLGAELEQLRDLAQRNAFLVAEGALPQVQINTDRGLVEAKKAEIRSAAEEIDSARKQRNAAESNKRSIESMEQAARAQAQQYLSDAKSSVRDDELNPFLNSLDSRISALKREVQTQESVVNRLATELGTSKSDYERLKSELDGTNVHKALSYQTGKLLNDPVLQIGRYVEKGDQIAAVSECQPTAFALVPISDAILLEEGDRATYEYRGVEYLAEVTGIHTPNQETPDRVLPNAIQTALGEGNQFREVRVELVPEALAQFSDNEGVTCLLSTATAKIRIAKNQ